MPRFFDRTSSPAGSTPAPRTRLVRRAGSARAGTLSGVSGMAPRPTRHHQPRRRPSSLISTSVPLAPSISTSASVSGSLPGSAPASAYEVLLTRPAAGTDSWARYTWHDDYHRSTSRSAQRDAAALSASSRRHWSSPLSWAVAGEDHYHHPRPAPRKLVKYPSGYARPVTSQMLLDTDGDEDGSGSNGGGSTISHRLHGVTATAADSRLEKGLRGKISRWREMRWRELHWGDKGSA